MGSSTNFGSMDEFLLHILTLRSNSVYREDFALLAKEADSGDWVKTQPLDGRVFGAARNLVSTWDLICRIAATIPAADKKAKDQDLARFRKETPLGSMWLMLKPAIEELKASDRASFPADYARNFDDMGAVAAKALDGSSLLSGLAIPAPDNLSNKLSRDIFRTAAARTRQLTHFG